MKKSWLTIIAFLVASFSYAQSNISVGPSVGLGYASMTGDDDDIKNQYQPAVSFGAAFVFSTENHFGLGLDLRYSIEGANKENNNAAKSRTTRLDYIRVPVKAIYF